VHFDDHRAKLASGLLSFPVTDFDDTGEFAEAPYHARLAWMGGFSPAALFAAGGTGEFFSLTASEHRDVTRAAVEKAKHWIALVCEVLSLIFLIVLTWYGTRFAWRIIDTSPTWAIPRIHWFIVMPLSSGIMLIYSSIRIVRLLRGRQRS
jgi:hypothetical protein